MRKRLKVWFPPDTKVMTPADIISEFQKELQDLEAIDPETLVIDHQRLTGPKGITARERIIRIKKSLVKFSRQILKDQS